jgi:hypothetical protein
MYRGKCRGRGRGVRGRGRGRGRGKGGQGQGQGQGRGQKQKRKQRQGHGQHLPTSRQVFAILSDRTLCSRASGGPKGDAASQCITKETDPRLRTFAPTFCASAVGLVVVELQRAGAAAAGAATPLCPAPSRAAMPQPHVCSAAAAEGKEG